MNYGYEYMNNNGSMIYHATKDSSPWAMELRQWQGSEGICNCTCAVRQNRANVIKRVVNALGRIMRTPGAPVVAKKRAGDGA